MKTILIIEDDAILRGNTAELLLLSDYEVLTASNGKTGVEIALKHLPDLIICDIMMPEMDGYQVLDTLTNHERTRYIPFIFLSAKTKHKEVRKGMDLGADDYLTKPFEEEDLLNSVETRISKAKIMTDRQSADQGGVEESLSNLNQLKNFFCDEGEVVQFKKDEIVFDKGDRSNKLYLILSGLVKTHILDSSGKELITGLYKPDDFLGFTSFESNIPFTESATTMEETEMVGLSKEYLKNILHDNREVTLELMNLLTDNLEEFKQQLMRMAYSSVRKKTASTLIQFAGLSHRAPAESIRIARNDLAANAGIAPESLIRTLSEFKKNKLIEIEGRTIHILDMQGLRQID